MVGTTTAPSAGLHNDITALLAQQPVRGANYGTDAEYTAARVAWLFSMAEALDNACLTDDAQEVREAALTLVRESVEQVSGGAA